MLIVFFHLVPSTAMEKSDLRRCLSSLRKVRRLLLHKSGGPIHFIDGGPASNGGGHKLFFPSSGDSQLPGLQIRDQQPIGICPPPKLGPLFLATTFTNNLPSQLFCVREESAQIPPHLCPFSGHYSHASYAPSSYAVFWIAPALVQFSLRNKILPPR